MNHSVKTNPYLLSSQKIWPELTSYEIECLNLVSVGKTRKEIAERLNSNERSIRATCERVADKLNIPVRELSLTYQNRLLDFIVKNTVLV